MAKQVPTLRRIVLTKKLPDEKEAEIRNKAKEVNIEIMLFNELRVSETDVIKEHSISSLIRPSVNPNQQLIM